ncbi:hypothetical protein BRADI_1g12222v3 [Brachypodium distachyon]|uniref:Uncharacterized protein n=1 Tax=Brachypodium distachyon TaxID=15368 RepID=A0A0Q3J7D1_BRADI|nr:hypothetical protein BRADI_1g12222v3 [Brachypodium distachyon]
MYSGGFCSCGWIRSLRTWVVLCDGYTAHTSSPHSAHYTVLLLLASIEQFRPQQQPLMAHSICSLPLPILSTFPPKNQTPAALIQTPTISKEMNAQETDGGIQSICPHIVPSTAPHRLRLCPLSLRSLPGAG